MPDLFSPQTTGVFDGTRPPVQQPGNFQRAKLRSIIARINLASLAVTTADNVLIGTLGPGAVPLYGVILASATMGASATLAIGTNKTHASNGQYRAAAVFTAVDVPTLFGLSAAMGVEVATETPIYLTNGVANLPSAGILIIEIFYTTQS
ncbi:MAG: hypothetical protein ACOYLS_01315 [Polymorphobacter sp.]